jgi:hypothetical protein
MLAHSTKVLVALAGRFGSLRRCLPVAPAGLRAGLLGGGPRRRLRLPGRGGSVRRGLGLLVRLLAGRAAVPGSRRAGVGEFPRIEIRSSVCAPVAQSDTDSLRVRVAAGDIIIHRRGQAKGRKRSAGTLGGSSGQQTCSARGPCRSPRPSPACGIMLCLNESRE